MSIYTDIGTSLAVQWLRLCASTAGGAGSIPGAARKKEKMYTDMFADTKSV